MCVYRLLSSSSSSGSSISSSNNTTSNNNKRHTHACPHTYTWLIGVNSSCWFARFTVYSVYIQIHTRWLYKLSTIKNYTAMEQLWSNVCSWYFCWERWLNKCTYKKGKNDQLNGFCFFLAPMATVHLTHFNCTTIYAHLLSSFQFRRFSHISLCVPYVWQSL